MLIVTLLEPTQTLGFARGFLVWGYSTLHCLPDSILDS